MRAQYALHLSCEALSADPEDKAQCPAKWGWWWRWRWWWWNGVQIEVRKDQQWYFSHAISCPYPLSRPITFLISRRRARVSERMRTRKMSMARGWGAVAVVLLPENEASEKLKLTDYTRHTHTCMCVHASYEKLGTGLDNDPSSEVKASRQRQQTQIPPSCGSRWQREALRRASKRVAAYLLIMQDKVPYTHTYTRTFTLTCKYIYRRQLPCDRICRVHVEKYKKVPLTALINWVNMSKNELMAAREKEQRRRVQCNAANYNTGQVDSKGNSFSPTLTCLLDSECYDTWNIASIT